MRWYVADKGYLTFLHSIDRKVEYIDYGDRVKLYFGIILEIHNYNYYLPVSSPKSKHADMKNSRDFLKLIDKDSNELIAVLNINNMVPIPAQYIKELEYDQIGQYRIFNNEIEESKYVDLLRKELETATSMSVVIKSKALALYEHYKLYPDDSLSSRCCNFILLEQKSGEYNA